MKTLNKYDHLTTLSIWQPRWHDRRVLLACNRVDASKTDNLKIVFTQARTMKGDWYLSRKKVRRFKKESNGSIFCYSVPLEELEPLIINERDLREVW